MTSSFDALTVDIGPGPLFLDASAGTGKTFAMVQLALRILLGDTAVKSRGPRHLLLITFTRAAAAELKDRLREAIRSAAAIHEGRRQADSSEQWIAAVLQRGGPDISSRLELLLHHLDELAVTTINSFGAGILHDFAAECGVPTELQFLEDDLALYQLLQDDELRRLGWADPWQAAALACHPSRPTPPGPGDSDSAHQSIEDDGDDEDQDAAELAGKRAAAVDEASLVEAFQNSLLLLRQQWQRSEAEEALSRASWKKDRPLVADPAFRSEIFDQVEALIDGEPAALTALEHLQEGLLEESMMARSKAHKALREEILSQPSLVAANRVRSALFSWAELLRNRLESQVADALPARKLSEGLITYDDQITLVSQALSHPERGPELARLIAARYDAVLLDEAQDTSRDQWTIIRRAFTGLPQLVVGDPKQTIYAWRGADLDSYLLERDAAGAERIQRLERNWRSTGYLLDSVASLFTLAPDPFAVPAEVIDFVPVRPGRSIAPLSDPESSAALRWFLSDTDGSADDVEAELRHQVVAEIRRLISGKVTWNGSALAAGDIAILVRTHKLASRYQKSLRRAGINAVLAGSGDVTETRMWREVLLLLRALTAPGSSERQRLAAATLLAGYPADSLRAWLDQPQHPEAVAWSDLLHRQSEIAARRGVHAALWAIVIQRGSVARLAAQADGERLLTDLRHILALMQQADTEQQGSPARIAAWMERSAEFTEVSGEYRQLRLESDQDAVQIRTIHAAKGLEYPVVFLPDTWRSINLNRGNTQQVLADAMRLFYVAITRARYRCYLALAHHQRQSNLGALGHLLRSHPHRRVWPYELEKARELIADSQGRMDQVTGSSERSISQPLASAPADLRALAKPTRPLRTWSITSYSALSHSAPGEVEPLAVDFDDPAEPLPGLAHPGGLERPDTLLTPGPQAGVALHALLEHLDFNASDQAIAAAVATTLPGYGLSAGLTPPQQQQLNQEVSQMLIQLLRSPVPGWGFALNQVSGQRSIREWQMLLSLDQAQLRDLALSFDQAGPEYQGYAQAVLNLDLNRLQGFLKGIVDLVFEYQGGWYLVDWKTNWLGNGPEAYSRPAMQAAMRRNHYYLQRALYRLAVERFLRLRAPGATVVGAGYAFLRGNAWLI